MRTASLLMCVLLAGCATSPIAVNQAKPVPPERVFAFQDPAAVTATIVRDAGLSGHGCGINVTVDGTRAAFIGAGEKVALHVTVGNHLLAVQPSDRGLCSVNNDAQQRTLKFQARAEESPQFRISTLSSGDLMLAQTR